MIYLLVNRFLILFHLFAIQSRQIASSVATTSSSLTADCLGKAYKAKVEYNVLYHSLEGSPRTNTWAALAKCLIPKHCQYSGEHMALVWITHTMHSGYLYSEYIIQDSDLMIYSSQDLKYLMISSIFYGERYFSLVRWFLHMAKNKKSRTDRWMDKQTTAPQASY